jgi:microcystin-dependent protein
VATTLTTPDGIPYVSSTQRGGAADVPILSEDQALAIQAALIARAAAADSNSAELIPVGTIVAFGGRLVPPGWHACDGTAHNSGRLTTVLTGNGQANPTLTPNLVDRFIVATSPPGSPTTSQYAISGVGGANAVQLTGPESGIQAHTPTGATLASGKDHTHSGQTGNVTVNATHTHTAAWTEGVGMPEFGQDGHYLDSVVESATTVKWDLKVSATNTDHKHNFSTGFGSADHTHTVVMNQVAAKSATASHENRPPYYALIYIIRKGPNGT